MYQLLLIKCANAQLLCCCMHSHFLASFKRRSREGANGAEKAKTSVYIHITRFVKKNYFLVCHRSEPREMTLKL